MTVGFPVAVDTTAEQGRPEIIVRIAFIGKGGAGKSALAGTFARLLASQGEAVLVIDSDPMPGLALSLGMPVTDEGIPDDATVERAEGETDRGSSCALV